MMTPLEAPYAVSKLLTGMKEMVTLNRKEQRRLVVYYQGHCLTTKPAPLEAPVLRVRNTARVIPNMTDSGGPDVPVIAEKKTLPLKPSGYTKPGPDHPWRRPFKVRIDRG